MFAAYIYLEKSFLVFSSFKKKLNWSAQRQRRKRKGRRVSERRTTHQVPFLPNACICQDGCAEVRTQKLRWGLLWGKEKLKYLTCPHCLLVSPKIYFSRVLGSEVELGSEPEFSAVESGTSICQFTTSYHIRFFIWI